MSSASSDDETDNDLEDVLRTGSVRAAEEAKGRRGVVRGRLEGVSGAKTLSSSSEADVSEREKATFRFALPVARVVVGVLLASRKADFVGDADRDCGWEREGVLTGVDFDDVVSDVVFVVFSFFLRISLIVARMDSFSSTHSSSSVFTRREKLLSDTLYLSTNGMCCTFES
jgi:hypothetical protein